MLWKVKDNLYRIGNKVGKVLEIDFISEPTPHWRKFVLTRVEIEISKPLNPGFRHLESGLGWKMISVTEIST